MTLTPRPALRAVYVLLFLAVLGLAAWRVWRSPDAAVFVVPLAFIVLCGLWLLIIGTRVTLNGNALCLGMVGFRRTVQISDLRQARVDVLRGTRGERLVQVELGGVGSAAKPISLSVDHFGTEKLQGLLCELRRQNPQLTVAPEVMALVGKVEP